MPSFALGAGGGGELVGVTVTRDEVEVETVVSIVVEDKVSTTLLEGRVGVGVFVSGVKTELLSTALDELTEVDSTGGVFGTAGVSAGVSEETTEDGVDSGGRTVVVVDAVVVKAIEVTVTTEVDAETEPGGGTYGGQPGGTTVTVTDSSGTGLSGFQSPGDIVTYHEA